MSSQDKGSKTEKPTPHKLREARKKGQVSKSKDVTSFVSTVALTLLIYVWFSFFWQNLMSLQNTIFVIDKNSFEERLPFVLHHIFEMIVILSLPVILVALVSAVIGNMIQIGFIFSWHPVKPDISKLDPVQGMKRIFGAKNFIDFLRSFLKLVILVASIYFVIKISIVDLFYTVGCGLGCSIELWSMLTLRIVLLALILFMVIAIFDFSYQRHHFMSEQKMSKDDVKREHKSMEGDPQIKGKRKQIHRETSSEDIVATVKSTTLIVYSGSYLVGMRYQYGETPLPIITLMAKQGRVKNVLGLAQKLDVTAHEDSALASKLFNNAKLNEYIPAKLITEVAEIFSSRGVL